MGQHVSTFSQYSELEQLEIDGLLFHMNSAFRDFEEQVPPPKLHALPDGRKFEYENKGIKEAIVLKAARILSLVNSSLLLADKGFIQELGILQRAMFDTHQDILLLVFGVTLGKEELHERFLEEFWRKPIDESGQLKSHKRHVPRRKITAYLIRETNKDNEFVECEGIRNARSIHNFESGYVHGSSEQIMDLYYPRQYLLGAPCFHTNGLEATHRAEEYKENLWNYIYRAVLSYMRIASVFGLNEHATQLHNVASTMVKNGHVGFAEPPRNKA